MRPVLFAVLLGAGLLVAPARTRADGSAEATRRAQVVATVGGKRTVTVGELEDRLAAMPAFQRATLGADAAAIRRAYLEQVMVPELLQSLGAEGEKLDQLPPVAFQLQRARSQAAVRAIRARIGPASAISAADVQKYYDDNRGRYDTPERYQLWRILCATRDEAQAVLDQARKDPTPKTFGELARDHSLDKASNLRAGNLGFLTADGASSEPGLRVEPSIVHAAQGVHDGQLVPNPVPEGEHFSVVWRRGTIAANRRAVEDVAAQIRDTVWKARVKEGTDQLVASLRAAKLRDLNEGLLATLGTTPVADAAPLPLTLRGADASRTP